MDFHGIDMQGYFKAQTVVDASALSWSANDEAKIVYDEVTEDLWIADDVGPNWKNAGLYVDTPLGAEMWFYADSAPDGWSIVTAGDELLAVKGGSTYTTGGQVAGNWATPAHSHVMGNHLHNVIGNTGQSPLNHGDEGGGNDTVNQTHVHQINANTIGPTPSSTRSNGSSLAYRPKARVGLICERV